MLEQSQVSVRIQVGPDMKASEAYMGQNWNALKKTCINTFLASAALEKK